MCQPAEPAMNPQSTTKNSTGLAPPSICHQSPPRVALLARQQ